MQRLRRDALVDFAVAVLVTIVVLVMTAGLGVVALIEVPAALVLIASVYFERSKRKRRR